MQDISFQKLHRKHHNHAKKPSVLGRMHKTHFFAPVESELYKMHGMDFRKPYHKHHDPTKKRRILGHMHKRHSYSTPDRQLFEMQDINACKPHHKHHDRTKKLDKKRRANIWGPNSSRKVSKKPMFGYPLQYLVILSLLNTMLSIFSCSQLTWFCLHTYPAHVFNAFFVVGTEK